MVVTRGEGTGIGEEKERAERRGQRKGEICVRLFEEGDFCHIAEGAI